MRSVLKIICLSRLCFLTGKTLSLIHAVCEDCSCLLKTQSQETKELESLENNSDSESDFLSDFNNDEEFQFSVEEVEDISDKVLINSMNLGKESLLKEIIKWILQTIRRFYFDSQTSGELSPLLTTKLRCNLLQHAIFCLLQLMWTNYRIRQEYVSLIFGILEYSRNKSCHCEEEITCVKITILVGAEHLFS